MTVNIVISVVTLLGCIIGHPPLNVIQMLWANLVMDILAAISLSTEAWEDDSSEGGLNKRQSRKANLITPQIWATILPQAAYQIVVMIILMFFSGLFMFEKPVNLIYTPLRLGKDEGADEGKATDRLVMDTFIFHCFVLMNLFNSFNCRIIDPEQLNIFHNIKSAKWFIAVLVGEFAFQQYMINQGSTKLTMLSAIFGTAELSKW